eukprot:365736-Chlamydomonas_euryale.AAC.13
MQPLGGPPGSGSGSGVLDWQMYIIQEYCDGGSLFDAIQALSRPSLPHATDARHPTLPRCDPARRSPVPALLTHPCPTQPGVSLLLTHAPLPPLAAGGPLPRR